jgi:putative membrane protein
MFQQEIVEGANPAVVSFAQQTLPLLQAHYQQAAILADVQPSAITASAPATTAAARLGELGDQDAAFVNQAMTANLTEIAEGRDAAAQSDSVAVDEYGRWMVADHTAMSLALQNIAGDELPSVSPEPPPSNNGSSFDDTYLTNQVLGHAKALMQFITQAETGQNAALVDYAQSALPVLAQHLASAIEIRFGVDLPDKLSAGDFGYGDLLKIATSGPHITDGKVGLAGQATDYFQDKLSLPCGHNSSVTW